VAAGAAAVEIEVAAETAVPAIVAAHCAVAVAIAAENLRTIAIVAEDYAVVDAAGAVVAIAAIVVDIGNSCSYSSVLLLFSEM